MINFHKSHRVNICENVKYNRKIVYATQPISNPTCLTPSLVVRLRVTDSAPPPPAKENITSESMPWHLARGSIRNTSYRRETTYFWRIRTWSYESLCTGVRSQAGDRGRWPPACPTRRHIRFPIFPCDTPPHFLQRNSIHQLKIALCHTVWFSWYSTWVRNKGRRERGYNQ
jgi:hypothetical protein